MMIIVSIVEKVLFSDKLFLIFTLCLFFCNPTSGFTELRASLNEACIGEEVTLTCATTAFHIRWAFSLRDRSFPEVARLFRTSDSIGLSYNISTNGLHVYLELTTNSMGVLNSTLLIRATAAVDQASIQCEGTVTRYYTFRIARSPNRPTNITISQKAYDETGVNFTLTWNLSLTGRVDTYNVNVSYEPNQLIQYSTKVLSVEVQGSPYDEEVFINITSVNCHSESEKTNFNFTINRCNVRVLQEGLLINDSSHSLNNTTHAPGYEIVFSCRPGYVPKTTRRAICQENGTWSPDPNKLVCLVECDLPLFNNHLEIINETFNGTVVGSELHFRCQNGFVNNNLRPAVCSSEGLWVPNPQEYECQQVIIKEDVLQNSSRCHDCEDEAHSQFSDFVIIISSTVGGFCLFCLAFTSVCICLCCVGYKKQRRRHNNISMAIDQGAGIEKAPVYDTIDPAYEVIGTGLGGEIKLAVTMNDAYNW